MNYMLPARIFFRLLSCEDGQNGQIRPPDLMTLRSILSTTSVLHTTTTTTVVDSCSTVKPAL